MGAFIFQDSRMSSIAARLSSVEVQMGMSSRFWRQMFRKPGSRMVTCTVAQRMACLRSRAATLSESRATPVRMSSGPTRFRRKVMELPMDLGGGSSLAGTTGLCSSPAA